MSYSPVVSVVTIFLNEERFIEEAIHSILAQTYTDWELLLVDDGSTDASTEIAKRYAEKYPEKIRYLEHEGHQNCGMSATRNLGIKNARGNYIGFLDGDDVYLPHKLEQQVAILDSQSEAAMVYGHTQDWFGWTGNPEDMERDLWYDLGVPTDAMIPSPTLLCLVLQKLAPSSCTCGVLIRREVVDAVGGFEASFRGLYEDQAFFAKVLLRFPVFVSNQFWDKYRQHPDSCCYQAKANKQKGEYYGRLRYLNWLKQFLDEFEASKSEVIALLEVHKALQNELWPYHHPILFRILRRVRHTVEKLKISP
jgi:glycosyltransferase involved in cell wall biosynthesis